jgi:hypothetical protein
MKRFLTAAIGLSIFVGLGGQALAQRNPRGTTKLTLKGKTISVEYGRPSLRGRSESELLDKLQPGDFWRLGADKSTTFSSGVDLAFGDVAVAQGEYSLWAQREAEGWKLVFNKQHGQWGTQHDAAQDVASVPLKESKAPAAEEMVTIALGKEGAGGVLTIQWGHMKLSANFTAK